MHGYAIAQHKGTWVIPLGPTLLILYSSPETADAHLGIDVTPPQNSQIASMSLFPRFSRNTWAKVIGLPL